MENAARFRAIVHNSSELVVVTDGDGSITYISPEPARRIGYDAEQLIGVNAFDLLHPDEAPEALEALGGSLSGPGVKETAEVRVRTADGGWRLFEVVPTNMTDDPDVAGFVFHLRDLTERYEQQRAFRLMFENSPVPQVQSYPGGEGIHANLAFAQLIGYSREELLARSLNEFVHEDDRAALIRDRERLTEGAPEINSMRRFVRKDGSMFYARVQATAVHDAAGSVQYFYGAFEDVTAEFEARSALEASEARLRAIIDNSPDIVAVLHPNGHWEASKQASRLLGYDPSDAPTGGPFALLHPDDAPIAAEALREVLSGSRTPMEPIELRLKAANGSYWTFECVGQNLGSDVEGGGVVITARNVEERKRAERGAPGSRRAVPDRVRALAAVRFPRRSRRVDPRHQRGRRRAHAEHARGLDRHRRAGVCAPGGSRPLHRGDLRADQRARRGRRVPHGAARRLDGLGHVARRAVHAGRRPAAVRDHLADRHHRAPQPRGTTRAKRPRTRSPGC